MRTHAHTLKHKQKDVNMEHVYSKFVVFCIVTIATGQEVECQGQESWEEIFQGIDAKNTRGVLVYLHTYVCE